MNIVGNVAGAGRDQATTRDPRLCPHGCAPVGWRESRIVGLPQGRHEARQLGIDITGCSPSGPLPSLTPPVMDEGTVCAQASASFTWRHLSGTTRSALASCPGASLLP